jgi:hypothetical protein
VRIELTIEVLQTSALPLGYRAGTSLRTTRQNEKPSLVQGFKKLERETGFEPATSTLARSHSTTELLPLVLSFYCTCAFAANSLHPHHPHRLPLILKLLFHIDRPASFREKTLDELT